MAITPPSGDDLAQIADGYRLGLGPADIEEFRAIITGALASYDEVERMYGARLPEPPARSYDWPTAQANELGLTMVGVPEELGGAMSERSSVTGVLAAEALAHGDMGLAVSLLAPAGVATALARFGDATAQATYLPAFTGDAPAPAAVAVLERGALFDPFALKTTARRAAGGWTLDGENKIGRASCRERVYGTV